MTKNDKQSTLDSEDYADRREFLSGGQISEEGLKIRVEGMPEVLTGKHGEFYSVPVQVLEGEDAPIAASINFTHKGLHQLIVANIDRLTKSDALIRGFGEGVERRYQVELILKK